MLKLVKYQTKHKLFGSFALTQLLCWTARKEHKWYYLTLVGVPGCMYTTISTGAAGHQYTLSHTSVKIIIES